MHCPLCKQPMEIYEVKITYSKTQKEYQRTRYRCREDDVWGMLEIPKAYLSEEEPLASSQKPTGVTTEYASPSVLPDTGQLVCIP